MPAITVRLFVVLLLAAGALPGGTSAQTMRTDDVRQDAKPAAPPAPEADIARIRTLLAERPGRLIPPKDALTSLNLTYHVEVWAYKPSHFATLAEQFDEWLPKSDVPDELAEIGRAIQYLHPLNAIQAARGAWYRHKVAKTRQAVEEELRAFEAQAQAAGPTVRKPQ